MTDDLTINDGTTTRVYKTTMGGRQRLKDGGVEHIRKTAEFDDTPETLTMRQYALTKNRRFSVGTAHTKVDGLGVPRVLEIVTTVKAVQGVHTQAEVEQAIAEQGVILANSTIRTDMTLGGL
jgi:hypothetical protein